MMGQKEEEVLVQEWKKLVKSEGGHAIVEGRRSAMKGGATHAWGREQKTNQGWGKKYVVVSDTGGPARKGRTEPSVCFAETKKAKPIGVTEPGGGCKNAVYARPLRVSKRTQKGSQKHTN